MEYQYCKPCRLKTQDIHAKDPVGLFYFLLKPHLVTQITIILNFPHYPFLRRKTFSKILWRHGVFSLFGDCPLTLLEPSSFIVPLPPLLQNSIFSAIFLLARQAVIRHGAHLPFHFYHCWLPGAGGEWVGPSSLTSHHPSTFCNAKRGGRILSTTLSTDGDQWQQLVAQELSQRRFWSEIFRHEEFFCTLQ